MSIMDKIHRIKNIGNDRLLYTKQWEQAKKYIIEVAKEKGLKTREDPLGNVFCRLEGYDDTKTIAVMSHFDSVMNGGAYDGIVGVFGGIEALSMLQEKYGRPDISLEVICIADEEGARFRTTFLGSRALLGELRYENILKLVDEDGIKFTEAIKSCSYECISQDKLNQCIRNDIISCLELHIEQGKYLHETGVPIGIVTKIPGQMKVKMTIYGEASHAGTTPMFERKDALCCAAKIISFVEHIGIKYNGITTTGYSRNATNITNVIPSKVELIHDIRNHDQDTFKQMFDDLYIYAQQQEERRGVKIHFDKLIKIEPAMMSKRINETIKNAATRFGYRNMELKSFAGHDIQVFASAGIQTGLIFIPSKDGISHAPEEYTEEKEIVNGVRVLTKTLKNMAYKFY